MCKYFVKTVPKGRTARFTCWFPFSCDTTTYISVLQGEWGRGRSSPAGWHPFCDFSAPYLSPLTWLQSPGDTLKLQDYLLLWGLKVLSSAIITKRQREQHELDPQSSLLCRSCQQVGFHAPFLICLFNWGIKTKIVLKQSAMETTLVNKSWRARSFSSTEERNRQIGVERWGDSNDPQINTSEVKVHKSIVFPTLFVTIWGLTGAHLVAPSSSVMVWLHLTGELALIRQK